MRHHGEARIGNTYYVPYRSLQMKSLTGILIGLYYLSQKEGRTDQKGRRMDGSMDTWTHGRMERLIKEPAEFNTGGFLTATFDSDWSF